MANLGYLICCFLAFLQRTPRIFTTVLSNFQQENTTYNKPWLYNLLEFSWFSGDNHVFGSLTPQPLLSSHHVVGLVHVMSSIQPHNMMGEIHIQRRDSQRKNEENIDLEVSKSNLWKRVLITFQIPGWTEKHSPPKAWEPCK